ncbi:MAG: HAD family hydrolase [Moraxellaceae bacterium]|nr:MAG: HAD family hydrolase [Moraxellaceae bacterium]
MKKDISKDYELIIFDWDGTLMDSLAKIVSSMQKAGSDAGLPILSTQEIHEIIGLELGIAIAQLYPSLAAKDVDYISKRYSHHYVESDQQPSLFYPGIEAMLHQLAESGKKLSIATGKSRRGLDRVLTAVNLHQLFDGTRCADETHSKPHPAMVNELLALHGLRPDQAIVVGDTEFDMGMALSAGVDRVGVSWGAHDAVRLHAYDLVCCVDTSAELTDVLMG